MELSINLEVLLILLLITLNGVLAMSEIAIVSARKTRLQQLADEGDVSARIALDLAKEPNRFLSTIQIGITLVGILAGAYGGATLAEQLSAWLRTYPILAPYSNALGLGVVVLVITYLSLVIGELVPKRIALHSPERIASLVARPMALSSRLAGPVVALLSFSTDGVLRLFGIRETAEHHVTEDEIRILIRQGAQTGLFEEVEHDMVERVLRFGDRPISSLMTPRNVIEAIDIEDPWEENLARIKAVPHSLFPVCEGSLDKVLGMIHVKDMLVQSLESGPLDPMQALCQPIFVPEGMSALKVLESFRQSSNHIALVTDEYGVVQGLVTLTDLLEGLVGDIPTVDELAERQIVQREDGSWLLDGMISNDEVKKTLGLESLPDEDKGNYQTLGGFVTMKLERIPAPADFFTACGWRFEVMDMDGNRVDKVLAQKLPDDPETPEPETLRP